MNKEANVHRLPTEKGTIATYKKTGNLAKPNFRIGIFESDIYQPQHLYVTTDEEIKEGDHILINGNKVTTATKFIAECIKNNAMDSAKNCKKIIATTDQLLTEEGRYAKMDKYKSLAFKADKLPSNYILSQIQQSFIEEYYKAGGIDKILVEYEVITNTYDNMVDLMCPHSVAEYEQTTSSTLKLKTDTNNCIIIHPVTKDYYPIYDEATNKTLHVQAPDLKQAEVIASYLNFDDFFDGQQILTNPTIHPVEEKMYSRKEIEEKCRLAFIAGFSVPSTKIGVDEWIKENL